MYLCMYTCISIQIDKLIETISILLLTALCLYQHNWFVQKPLCPSVFSVCFAPGQLFSFCLGVGIVLGWTWLFFFFGGRRTNTSKTIFLLVIKFIKTHGIQLLTLRVTLSLDGCDVIDWVKLATVQSSPIWKNISMDYPILFLHVKSHWSHWQFFFCFDLLGFKPSLETSKVLVFIFNSSQPLLKPSIYDFFGLVALLWLLLWLQGHIY